MTGRGKEVGEFKENSQISGLRRWVAVGYICRHGTTGHKPHVGLGEDEFSVTQTDLERPVFHTLKVFNMQINICV